MADTSVERGLLVASAAEPADMPRLAARPGKIVCMLSLVLRSHRQPCHVNPFNTANCCSSYQTYQEFLDPLLSAGVFASLPN